jgi:hypothetical protein
MRRNGFRRRFPLPEALASFPPLATISPDFGPLLET